jgi:hypothetical protein
MLKNKTDVERGLGQVSVYIRFIFITKISEYGEYEKKMLCIGKILGKILRVSLHENSQQKLILRPK